MNDLCDGGSSYASGSHWYNRLTVNIGYRNFSSFRHFVGTDEQEQREELGNQIKNHQNIWDVGINYQVSPKWSIIANVPVFHGSRNQLYNPRGIFYVNGIGDLTVGGQYWVKRNPTENNSNVAFSLALKIPTGPYDATGPALLADGTPVQATADQSMQPGDGGWGFTVGTQAYKQVWWETLTYFQGLYLFNPRNTNGVATFRSRPGETVMSVADQYLFRGGVAHAVPGVRGLSLSFGGRIEGIPVRDAFGGSDGFRRPGYIISVDPGLMFAWRKSMLSVNAPWAVERNRRRSTADIANDRHGDAAFADYTIIVGVSHRF